MLSWLLILTALWLPVIYLLGAQWTVYEQYHYGWAVPPLCAFFAWERAREKKKMESRKQNRGLTKSIFVFCFLLSALAYWFSRLCQEANPLWRAASYGLVISAGAITLLLVYFVGGKSLARQFIFPVAFFLIAVPWPTPVEGFIVQNLSRFNTSFVTEILSVFGIAALAQGNVIQLSNGAVGVEEACSGIRSLQATLMISLFFGEFFHFRTSRRIALVAGGIVLALVFNICRTFFLAWIAFRYGMEAVEKWHDPAGIFVLACFLGTAAMALFFRKVEREKRQSEVESQKSPVSSRSPDLRSLNSRSQWSMALAIIAFVLLVEISTEAWFRMHEARNQEVAQWSARWPAENPAYQLRALSSEVRKTLRYDEEAAAKWSDAQDHQWQGFYLRWRTSGSFYDRARASLAKGHRPEACLPAAGLRLDSELKPDFVQTRTFPLAFRRYVFESHQTPLHVFFGVFADDAEAEPAEYLSLMRSARLRMVFMGKRSEGQRVLEIAVSGFNSPDEAWKALQTELPKWIVEENAGKRKAEMLKAEN